jgi:hypothetical protein
VSRPPDPWSPWPRCACGAPAAPHGAPALLFEARIETRPEGNLRSWRARAARAADAIKAIEEEIAVALGFGAVLPLRGPWRVRLTRLAPRHRILDTGNLWAALKSTEDGVAAVLRADDGWASWGVSVHQETRATLGVRVEVWGPEALVALEAAE